MKQELHYVFAIAVMLGSTITLGVSAAGAFVLENKSDAQKLRKDIDKQADKHASCVIKAFLKCEASSGHSGVECRPDTGVVDYAGDPVLDPRNKQPGSFNSAISKCDEKKFRPSKKGVDYVGIGCPADCDDVADGIQRCADMAAYEADIEGSFGGAVKAQLPLFGAAIDAFCAADTGNVTNSTDPTQMNCALNSGDTVARYFKALGKCYAKCENDYKGKKGGGGDNDDPNCIVNDAAVDPRFQACADAALAKAQKKNPLSPTNLASGLLLANATFNDASNGLYNRSDPVVPGGNPCGTCGDNARAGAEACDGPDDALCVGGCNSDCTCGAPVPIAQETINIPSSAHPAETPGTSGVTITNPDLVTQLGVDADLNQARYTRYFLDMSPVPEPDSILILAPGFQSGAGRYRILGENLIRRAFRDSATVLEVWAFDPRSSQLEDLEGLDIAEAQLDPQIALDWLYGGELGLSLHAQLVAGPNRRAIFHNTSDDVPFLANWTALVFSHDIDAIVEAARSAARNANVFLGGGSLGTTFATRYASTDFDLAGGGPAEPGYAKLRGLVLLDGPGGTSAGTPPSADTLDRIEDRFDGGLFHAVRTGSNSCVDGTPCLTDTDCAGNGRGTCTPTASAYNASPRLFASLEPGAIQGVVDPDSGQVILQVDQGAPGNNAIAVIPELSSFLGALPPATALGMSGLIFDDDFGSPTMAASLGWVGPAVGGLVTWQTISESLPPEAFKDNGPAPTNQLGVQWGVEQEAVSFRRVLPTHFLGGTNYTDWYFPSSGLSVTAGLPLESPALLTSLDSSALSLDPPAGRGRRDIENLVETANVNIPVICLAGSNGIWTVPGWYVPFAQSIGTCTAPSCDSVTPRVVDATLPSPAFPSLGGVAGGFEVHITEGYAHGDVSLAEDNAGNNVVGPILDFINRNMQ